MRNCFFIALAAMAAVACQKGTDNIGPEPTSFSATIESYDATRTFTDGSLQVKWSPEDYLNVWEGRRASDKYTITPASVGKNYADLVLVKAGSTSGFVAKLPANIGYYPYVENIACSSEGDGFKLENIVLPDTQTFAVNSFGNGFMPMVAVTKGQDDYDLSFRNVCGVLRIVLSGELLVKTISVTGNNDEIICGAAELFVGNASLPSITMIGDGKTVSLDCGEGVQVGSMTSFDIVLPPVTFSQGFTININDEVHFRTERQQVIARSHILSMGNKTLSSDLSAAEYVDLGLSVKWAKYNLGASKPEGYGLYYQWGDTKGYGSDTSDGKYFDWKDHDGNVTYKWCNGSYNSLTKYNTYSSFGTVDNKTVLDMEDDAARAALGGKWRMPTDAEWTELRENCTWTWTSNYNDTGVAGMIVTSNKSGYTNKSIFLPAAGFRRSGDYRLNGAGSSVNYWSSSLRTDCPYFAWSVDFLPVNVNVLRDYDYRYYGQSVRPVSE